MKFVSRCLALLLLAGVLGACDAPPSREPFPKLTYEHLRPYWLTVSRIDIVDAYRPPMTPPNVEQNFPVLPSATAAQWARDRLIAAGGTSRAVYTVLRGDAVETHLPRDSGAGSSASSRIPRRNATTSPSPCAYRSSTPADRSSRPWTPRRPAAPPWPRTRP